LFLYICITVGDPVIAMGRVGISLTGLTPPCSCVCHKPAPGFPTPYVMVIFMLLFEVTGRCSFSWWTELLTITV